MATATTAEGVSEMVDNEIAAGIRIILIIRGAYIRKINIMW